MSSHALTREVALERARSIASVAGQYATECERLNELHPEVAKAILESELQWLLVPEARGGAGLGWDLALDCVIEVGRQCASAAWVLSFLIDHNWVICLFPEAAQQKVFAEGSTPAVFTASAPQGTVEAVEGGYRLNGEWSFASGVDLCGWGLIGALQHRADGPPIFLNMLVRKGDYEIRRVWDHFGLSGTGSHNVVLQDVFVPHDHAVSWAELFEGVAPGSKTNPGWQFQSPLSAAYPLGIMGPAIGAARGALDAFAAWITTKTPMLTPGKAAETLPLQARLGQASAQIDAGELLVRNLSEQARLEIVRDYLFAMELLTAGVDTLMTSAGARGGRKDSPIQRAFRDMHAMHQHALFNFDAHYGAMGRRLMGLGENGKPFGPGSESPAHA
jgi:3-hydroxy-9,10-secoandrosta-1,3,5(10)-triene-9,17-dione monooxygenase